jgi:hypothetical protein
MAKQIARLLKTNMMADIDMPALAQFLQAQGRKGDTVLAHINPKEAALLQKMGGAGTENPATGLPEFYDPYDSYDKPYSYGTTQGKIVETITAPEQQIYRAPRAELYAERVPDYTNSQTITAPDYQVNRQRGFTSPVMQDVPTASQQARNSFAAEFPSGEAMFTGAGDLSEPSYATRFTPNPFSDNLGLEMAARRDGEEYRGAGSFARYLPGTLNLAPVPENISRIPSEFATRPDLPEELAAVDNRNILRRGVDYLKEVTGLSGEELARLGLAGGLGIQGAMGARRMAEQGQEARREQEAIASPYRERGAALLAQAEGGELTPQAQQSLQAMRARLQQGVESRGGVGAQQAAAQVEAFRQQLLGNQFDYGMKISNIGDQIAMGAIRTGLEADRYASQMTNSYFTNMARLLAGMGGETEDAVTQSTEIRGAR